MAYTTTLQYKKQVAEGTWSFYFAKPEGFDYRAGQTIDLTLIHPPEIDEKGNTRTFSLASAPVEPDLMITTRMRDSAFKRVLGTLASGSEVSFDGAFGSMMLHRNTVKPAVFFAGGIGITPFRSMILQAVHEQLPLQITLFYSNRRPEDAPFLDELTLLQQKHSSLVLVTTMTDIARSKVPWSGEQGYIQEAMFRKYIVDTSNPIFYIAGPPPMVASLYQMLVKAGVDPDNIRTDEFAGY